MHAYIHTYRHTHTHTFSEHFWQTNSCTFQSSSSEAPPLVPMAWRQFGELSYGVEGSEKRPSRSDKICAALPDAEMIETQQSLVLGSIYIYTYMCVCIYIYIQYTYNMSIWCTCRSKSHVPLYIFHSWYVAIDAEPCGLQAAAKLAGEACRNCLMATAAAWHRGNSGWHWTGDRIDE